MVPMLFTKVLISLMESGVPIMTDFLQAREANIALTLDGLHKVFGESYNYEQK